MGFSEIRIPTVANALSAEKLSKTYIANVNLFAGEIVMALSPSTIDLATSNTTVQYATALGIVVSDTVAGSTATVALFGALTDPSFAAFTPNQPLFMGLDGSITATRPMKPANNYLTQIGKALGSNTIFIDVQPPMIL